MPVSKGQQAPDFTLHSDGFEPFRLAKATSRGPVMLLFFPGAFSSVCTTELNQVSNDLEAFGPDTQVVGISTDSIPVLAEFRRVNRFRFPLLSDHDADVAALYGAKYDRDFTPLKLDRIAKRSVFVIDRDGVVRFAQVLDDAGHLPDLERAREVLEEIA